MPVVIEDMQAEVLPERPREEAAPAEGQRSDAVQQARLLERVARELRIRDERDARWRAD